MLGGHLKEQSHPYKAMKYQKHGTNWTMQRLIVYSIRVEAVRQNVTVFNLS